MDPKHEVLFIRQMQQFIKNKTFIVITTKPILAFERLIVIEGGKIVLDGPRDEVLSNLNKTSLLYFLIMCFFYCYLGLQFFR